jgi:probable HAF family extracellular repeat protein
MNSRTPTCVAVIAILLRTLLLAQDHSAPEVYHYHYRLAKIGTFGGPNVELAVEPIAQILSNAGVAVGEADTSALNPYYPNGNPFVGNGVHVGHAFSWQDGALTDLGGLPGGLNSGAVWINEKSVVAGNSENGEIDPLLGFPEGIAVLWQNGNTINLGTLDGGYESIANAVNNRGQVTGPALNLVPDPYSMLGLCCLSVPPSHFTETRGFIWEKGVMRDLGTLGGPDTFAIYINDRGQIAGQSYTNSTPNSASDPCGTNVPTVDPFIWQSGQMIDLGTLGGTCGSANGLNNRGEVVGQSDMAGDQTFHPFLWDWERLRDLGTIGGNFGSANWLNDAGEVVGWATVAGDQVNHAFRWKNGAMTDLGTLAAFPCSSAKAINSRGQTVGESDDCISVEHAVLWQDGHAIDLNDFVPPDSRILLEEADFINDLGEIIGYSLLANGDERAYVLVPCDQDQGDGCHDETANFRSAGVATNPPSGSESSAAGQGNVALRNRLMMLGARFKRRDRISSPATRK